MSKGLNYKFGKDSVHILDDYIEEINGEERIPVFYTVGGIVRGHKMRIRFLELSEKDRVKDLHKSVEYYRGVNLRMKENRKNKL